MKKLLFLVICMASFFCGYSQEKKKINKVLIIGNSIVEHVPNASLGWTGNWGMAASVADSDFVHILTRKIHQINKNTIVEWKTVVPFERGFKSFDLQQLKGIQDIKADMIIIKISENVNDSTAVADDFKSHYKMLLNYLDPEKTAVRIIVDGFWIKPNVNRMIKETAVENKYPFVSITSLFSDDTNTAKGKFAHEGVAKHPSDKGMRMIAERIFAVVKTLL